MPSFKDSLFYALSMMLILLPSFANACFTVVAGKAATASGRVTLARNSDSKDTRRAKNFTIYATPEGHKLYIGLPYWDLAHSPNSDMAQVATNHHGVSISATQTIQNNQQALALDSPSFTGKGVTEANIPAIVMPKATTAREGIAILGKALETKGMNDSVGFGVLIGDSHEAWYFETLSGHQWVAIRIPDNMYFVAANGPGQIQGYEPLRYTYLFSNYNGINPINFASLHGFAYFENAIFNFRETYGDIQPTTDRIANNIRVAYAQHLLNPNTRPFNQAIVNSHSFPMLLTPEHPIQIKELQQLQASHYEEYPEFDPFLQSTKDKGTRPTYRPVANLRASNAHITEIGEASECHSSFQSEPDYSIANLEYIALGMPTLSFYLPLYYGITTIPSQLQGATNQADSYSLFWQFKKLQVLTFLHDNDKAIPYQFKARQTYINTHYKALYEQIAKKKIELEQNYQIQKDPKLIDTFTEETVDALSHLNQIMIQYFLNRLDIDKRYGLKNDDERNRWFTHLAREQECAYRSQAEVRC